MAKDRDARPRTVHLPRADRRCVLSVGLRRSLEGYIGGTARDRQGVEAAIAQVEAAVR